MADQLQIVLTKEQLKKAIQVADDPATRIFPIVRPSHDVSDALLFERLLRLADHADLGNGVDAHLQPLRDARVKSVLHVFFVAEKVGDGHFSA